MKNLLYLLLLPATIAFGQGGITDYPYIQDFNSDDGEWEPSGTNSSWAWTDETKGWATNAFGNYNANEDSRLESPAFDFTDFTEDPILIFRMSYLTESPEDNLWVEVDFGEGYETLGLASDGGWYTPDQNFHGGSSGYYIFAHELTGGAEQPNVSISFRFHSGAMDQNVGFVVDKVMVVAAFSGNEHLARSGNLPQYENFSDIQVPYDSPPFQAPVAYDIMAIPGLDGFSFSTRGGDISFIQEEDKSGYYAYLNALGQSDSANLVWTVDLEGYDVLHDLLSLNLNLEFTIDEHERNDAIFIRGSEFDPWLTFIHYGEIEETDDSYYSFDYVSDFLFDNEQNFSSTTQIRFGAERYSSIYLRDIQLFKLQDIDLGLIEATVPEPSPFLENNESLTLTIRNKGEATLSNMPLYLHITMPDHEIVVRQQIVDGPLASFETMDVTFSAIDLSADGEYQFKFGHSLNDDRDPGNNQLQGLKTSKMTVYSGPLPFVDPLDIFGYSTSSTDYNINGLKHASFIISEGNENSSLTAYGTDGQAGDDKSSTLRLAGSDNGSELLFNLNMEGYNAAEQNIRLSVDLDVHSVAGSTLTEMARILFRDSPRSEWTLLYDAMEKLSDHNQLQNVTVDNLSQILVDHEFEFTEYFQIKFLHKGSGYLDIDNLKIFENSLPEATRSKDTLWIANTSDSWNNLDLSGYFEDADNDELTYTFKHISGDNLVQHQFNENILQVAHTTDGVGIYRVTADDLFSGEESIETNFFDLVIYVPGTLKIVDPISGFVYKHNKTKRKIPLEDVFEKKGGDYVLGVAVEDTSVVEITGSLDSGYFLLDKSTGTSNIVLTAVDGEYSLPYDFDVAIIPNSVPYVANPISNVDLEEGFGSYELDISDVFDDLDDSSLEVTAATKDSLVDLSIKRNVQTDDGLVKIQLVLTDRGLNGTGEVELTCSDRIDEVSTTFRVNIQETEIINGLDESISMVYPNPTDGTITYRLPAWATQNTSYTVKDMQGKRIDVKLVNENEHEITLDLSTLNKGIYHLQVTDPHNLNRATLKIIKQ